jgi:predicted transcriptional regulator
LVSRRATKGLLEVDNEHNTNQYAAAVKQTEGLEREIDRFLEKVARSGPGNLELVEKAVRKAQRKTGWRG